MKRWGWLLGILLAGAGLLAWPADFRTALAKSIALCLSSLAPTLFPFLALTSLLLRTGAGELLARPLGPLCRLLRLPPCCGPVILASLLGGYPAGAKGVSLLLEQGRLTPAQAARMMLFCVNAGPAFVVSYAGADLLGDAALGGILLAAGSLSSLLLGLLTVPGAPKPQPDSASPPKPEPHPLVSAVNDACRATWGLCGWVVFFAGVTTLLRCTGALKWMNTLLALPGALSPLQAASVSAFLLEVTAGAQTTAALWASPPLMAFGLAFGGCCVHLQLFSCFPAFPGSRLRFEAFRLLHGGLSALLIWAALGLWPRAVPTGAGPVSAPPALAAPWTGGASLLLLSVVFLLFLSAEGPGHLVFPGKLCYNRPEGK